jgi:Family of unknown function (DUF6069)
MTIGNSLKNAAIGGVVGAVINAIIFFVSSSQGWISDEFPTADGAVVSIVPVIMASIIPALIGGALYWLLSSYVPNGVLIFWIISALFLGWSFFSPEKNIPNCPSSMAIALNVMHWVVASSVLYFLTGRRDNAFSETELEAA